MGYTGSVLDKMLIKASELPELHDSTLTADYSNMKVGKGWKLSVRQTVKEANIDNIPYIVYNDSDRTEHYFVEINGKYVDEDGFGLTLTVSGSGGGGGTGIYYHARSMYSMGAGRFNLLGITDFRLV